MHHDHALLNLPIVFCLFFAFVWPVVSGPCKSQQSLIVDSCNVFMRYFPQRKKHSRQQFQKMMFVYCSCLLKKKDKTTIIGNLVEGSYVQKKGTAQTHSHYCAFDARLRSSVFGLGLRLPLREGLGLAFGRGFAGSKGSIQ